MAVQVYICVACYSSCSFLFLFVLSERCCSFLSGPFVSMSIFDFGSVGCACVRTCVCVFHFVCRLFYRANVNSFSVDSFSDDHSDDHCGEQMCVFVSVYVLCIV